MIKLQANKTDGERAKMNLTEKLKIAMLKQGITQTELASRTGPTQNNLANKLKANNFKLSEYEKLVTACGCKLEINIIMPNREKV